MITSLLSALPSNGLKIFSLQAKDNAFTLMPELQAGYLVALLSRKINMNKNLIRVESVYPFGKYFSFLKQNISIFPEKYFIFFLENFYHSSGYALDFLKEILPLIPDKHIIIQSFKLSQDEAQELMNLFPQIQIVIHSDIEFVFSEIYIQKKPLSDIYNITFRGDHGIVKTPTESVEYNLADYILPAYIDGHIFREKANFNYITSLLDDDTERTNDKVYNRRSKKKYIQGLYSAAHKNQVMLTSGRGCRYKCPYCYRGVKYSTVRQIPLDVVKQDLDYLHSIGVKEVYFYDDCFLTTNFSRLAEMTDMLGLYDFKYYIAIRYEMCTEANFLLLEKLKFSFVQIGLQTVSENDFTKRSVRISNFSQVIERFKKQGAIVSIDLILGLPGETIYDFLRTFKYTVSLSPQYIVINSLFLNPSTELFEKKDILNITTRHSDMFNVDYIEESDTFPKKDLEKARKVVLKAMDLFPHITFTLR